MQRSKRDILIELLVIQTQAGDERAAADLFELWNPSVLSFVNQRILNSQDANDVAQESWLAIMKGLNRLRDAATFPAWSLQIVHHKHTDFIRRQIRERENLKGRHQQLQAEQTTSTAAQHQSQMADVGRAVEQEIGQLPLEDRRLLTLFYHQAMSIEEVSKITGRSVAAVKSKLFQLRQKIKTNIERNFHE
ncbi:MAG: RNA polymerase sigma factor [Pirellulaceae bacterium]|nr:RNA polymerase sigma factor [Pirellulaceae bacterium]